MKLSSEMIDGFGGKNSDHWAEFRKECYTAFLSLRRHANLILNLFSLMVDASVPDIAIEVRDRMWMPLFSLLFCLPEVHSFSSPTKVCRKFRTSSVLT